MLSLSLAVLFLVPGDPPKPSTEDRVKRAEAEYLTRCRKRDAARDQKATQRAFDLLTADELRIVDKARIELPKHGWFALKIPQDRWHVVIDHRDLIGNEIVGKALLDAAGDVGADEVWRDVAASDASKSVEFKFAFLMADPELRVDVLRAAKRIKAVGVARLADHEKELVRAHPELFPLP